MKLRTQIFSGYALLAVLVIAVAATGYAGLQAIWKGFDAAVNRTQPVLTALQEVHLQATNLAFGAAAHIAARLETDAAQPRFEAGAEEDEGDFQGFAVDTDTALMSAVAILRERITRHFPDEIETADAIEQRSIHLLGTLDTLRLADARADRRAFDAALAEVARALEALRTTVRDASASEEREFTEQQEEIESDFRRYLLAVIVACIASLLAAIAAGAALARHISAPVTALRRAAEKLGAGQLDTRIEVTADNEISVLQDAFNRMADDLSGSLVSRDYVEAIIESMAEGVIVVDAANRIERCNSAMQALCPKNAPLPGRQLDEVLHTDEELDALLGDGDLRGGFESRLRGTEEPTLVAVSVSPIRLADGESGRVLLVQDITERKRHEERLSYLASYDVLTGLPNRRMFLDHLRATVARLPWNKQRVGVLFCDLDRFKFVNDSLGHAVGDVLLQKITERIREVLRPGDVIGRWAGDEFVVLLDEIARPNDIELVAAKIVEGLRQPVQVGPHELFVTVSVGTACAPEDGLDADELVKNADLAMYAAKSAGKNHFAHYEAEMRSRTELRLLLEHALRSALDSADQLEVHYQPQQNLDGTLIGFEALVRWKHPQLGLISPAQFLPAAEEAGLMAALDEVVLRMACAELRRWRDAGWNELRIAVNLSNQSFRRDGLVDAVAAAIDEAGVPRSAVELELTEDIVMENVGSAVATMENLTALGVHLSIDDFGTGYSSLSQLKRCPIELLKIDRSFITDVIQDESDRAITSAIIALAHKLGIRVLAEGVETEAQLAMLREYGCDAIQGYLLSRPLPAVAAREWLAAQRRG